MEILRASEDYLESMLMMKLKHGYIRSIDVAEHLGVTKPSVTYATRRLKESGHITMDKDGLITLTETGMAVAAKMLDRHKTLTAFLIALGVDYELDTPAELAKAFHVKRELGLRGGLLVTNPIPEEYSMDKAVIDKAIAEAVEDAKKDGIHGKATTPYLLAKIKDLTGGDSLDSNIQLVFNNARLGAAAAVELAKLER